MSQEEYRRRLAAQGGVCAICKRTPDPVRDRGGVLAVDHDQENGEYRAFLCRDCSTALGLLGDDPARMRAAALCVEQWRAVYAPNRAER